MQSLTGSAGPTSHRSASLALSRKHFLRFDRQHCRQACAVWQNQRFEDRPGSPAIVVIDKVQHCCPDQRPIRKPG